MSSNLTATIVNEVIDAYDYQGAAIYIAVILIWYSIGLVLMLFFHVRPRTVQNQYMFDYETTNKSTPSTTTNPFGNYYNIQADNTKKQILNELKDPERRQRLWKIYYSTAEKQNEPHPRYYQTITADSVTIGRINRKLADIYRTGTRYVDDENLNQALDVPSNDTTKSFTKRFISARRSSGIVTTNSPRPLVRVQSQPDTPTAVANAEKQSFICDIEPKITVMNGSKKRNNKFLNRFTIEKVSSDTNKNLYN